MRLQLNDHYLQKLISLVTVVVMCLVWMALDPDKDRTWPLIPICLTAIVVSLWLGERVIRWRKRTGR